MTRKTSITAVRSRARRTAAATEHRILVGEAIKALRFYDTEHARNAFVCAAIAGRAPAIEHEFEDALFAVAARAGRRRVTRNEDDGRSTT